MGSKGGGGGGQNMAATLAAQAEARREDREYMAMQERMRLEQMRQQDEIRMQFEARLREGEKKAEIAESRKLELEQTLYTEEAEEIALDSDTETEEGLIVSWMNLLNMGMQSELPRGE
tara:strand:- start:8513 stop:8866 length:354 start_codon:yes stop_codon:yes gene_type:complete